MQINISGQQIDIGQSLQAHVQDVLMENIVKYFDRSTHAYVHFSKEAFLYKCDISVNRGTGDGTILNARAVSKDISQTFELAMAHLKKQLIKYKDKLKNHHHKDKEEIQNNFAEATKYILSSSNNEMKEEDNPVIIAEKSTNIPNLNVNEAVMRMDLLSLPALMFKNRANGKINIVYYREDGNISWIDPKEN